METSANCTRAAAAVILSPFETNSSRHSFGNNNNSSSNPTDNNNNINISRLGSFFLMIQVIIERAGHSSELQSNMSCLCVCVCSANILLIAFAGICSFLLGA